MRTPVAFALAALLVASPLVGQDTRLGVSAGFSSSRFGGDPPDMERHSAVTAGVTVGRGLSSWLVLESGVHWLQSGGSGVVAVEGGDESLMAAHELSYLTLPVLLRGTFLDVGGLRISALAGPSLAYRVDCDSGVDPGLEYLALVSCSPMGEQPRLDVGVLVGGGATVDRGRWAVTLDARYGIGLRNLRGSHLLTVRNESLAVTAGLSVPLGGG
jgi:hypothetical protein